MLFLCSLQDFRFSAFSFLHLHRCWRATSEISQLLRSSLWTSGCNTSLILESVIRPRMLIILISLSLMLEGKYLISDIYLEILITRYWRHPVSFEFVAILFQFPDSWDYRRELPRPTVIRILESSPVQSGEIVTVHGPKASESRRY